MSASNKVTKGKARSRKGCPECRKRKIKCDEIRPTCGQCHKSGRVCHSLDSVFKQHEYSFSLDDVEPVTRVRSESPQDLELIWDDPATNAGSLDDHMYLQHETATSDSIQPSEQDESQLPADPVNLPVQNVHLAPTYSTSNSLLGGLSEGHVQQALSWNQAAQTIAESISSPGSRISDRLSGLGDSLSPGALDASPNRQKQVLSYRPDLQSIPRISEVASIESRAQDFFLRHFFEVPGQWMDLPCPDKAFSRQVLLLSRNDLLVKFSTCALAAKQIGQVAHPEVNYSRTVCRSVFPQGPITDGRDFLWYGAKYYDKAIQLLGKYVSRNTFDEPDLPASSSSEIQAPHTCSIELEDYRTAQIVAACILCQYEKLSDTMEAWSSHLNGNFRLFSVVNDDLIQSRRTAQDYWSSSNPSILWISSFWCFTFHDLEESLILEKSTRMDTSDIGLWRRMGLPLTGDGALEIPMTVAELEHTSQTPQDVLYLRALIFLTCKVVNFEPPRTFTQSKNHASLSDNNEIAGDEITKWDGIQAELTTWYTHRPSTYYPDVISTFQDRKTKSLTDFFEKEVWYSNSRCAVAMMFYHMVQMLLLMRRPTAEFLEGRPSSYSQLKKAWRATRQRVRAHAAEIFSIVVGMPDDSVRVHMTQPVFVASSCLDEKADRRFILEILRSIEKDLGISTQHRITELSEDWDMIT